MKDGNRRRKMEKTEYDTNWLKTHLTVSKFPSTEKVKASGCDILVNVSDLYRSEVISGVREYWFPLGESFGFSLSSIYGALKVMYEAYRIDDIVLLHCHAGQNRSRTVYECLFYLISGSHAEKPERSKLMLNINDGQLPGIYKMEEFLDNCREVFQDADNQRPLDWIRHEMHMAGSGF